MTANPLQKSEPCPLCGGQLQETVSGCGSCPMNSGCGMLCCDNCGYSTVPARSKTIDFLKRIYEHAVPERLRGKASP